MAATMEIKWNGLAVVAGTRRAANVAVREVAQECVDMAKTIVNVDTGRLRDSLKVGRVHSDGFTNGIEWGSFDVDYAIYQELIWKPYLRPSADALYHKLPSVIRDNLL